MLAETEIGTEILEAAHRIANQFRSEKIILFGSYARGTAGPDSDADLLVIMNVLGSKRSQAVQIDLALLGIQIPTDLVVVTPDEVDLYRDCEGTLIYSAVREGMVLYDRAA